MTRLALFSFGFLIYTAVAAISTVKTPGQNREPTSGNDVTGVCSSESTASAINRLNRVSAL